MELSINVYEISCSSVFSLLYFPVNDGLFIAFILFKVQIGVKDWDFYRKIIM